MKIEISVKTILEKLAFNLYCSALWGEGFIFGDKIPSETIKAQREAFRHQVIGNLDIIRGTELCPEVAPFSLYLNVSLPQSIIAELNTDKYWPDWANLEWLNKKRN